MPNIVQQAVGPRRQRQLVWCSQKVAEHQAGQLAAVVWPLDHPQHSVCTTPATSEDPVSLECSGSYPRQSSVRHPLSSRPALKALTPT
jgi:hypothetical protein